MAFASVYANMCYLDTGLILGGVLMSQQLRLDDKKGHPIRIVSLERSALNQPNDILSQLFDASVSGLVVRNAFSDSSMADAVLALEGSCNEWQSPNQGMVGGEIRTIGTAATPTFTSFTGPSSADYLASQSKHETWVGRIFAQGSPTAEVGAVFSALNSGQPAHPPKFGAEGDWLPYNFRSLDQGHEIYAHHDNHYRLSIYDNLDQSYDRTIILSWFLVLRPSNLGGALKLYGLWGSDPNPPVLPTRFLDAQVLDEEYLCETVKLSTGDMVVFNSGKHVHRVSQVESDVSRITMGGFATVDTDRSHLVFWS
jgi:hapalindole-type alkaloid chlorinase